MKGEHIMMNTNTATKQTAMKKNTARVYNARNEKKSLKDRFHAYMKEVFEYYGEIARRTGYRTPLGF